MPVDIGIALGELFHSPQLHDKTLNLSTGKEEPKYNGRYSSIVGEDVSVVIGLGRQNKTIGPVINSKIDLAVAIEWGLETLHHKAHHFKEGWKQNLGMGLSTFGEGALGQGGDTDFQLGNKTSFNYGSSDFHVTHKFYPTTTIEYIEDTPTYKWAFKAWLTLYLAFEISFSVAIKGLHSWHGLDIHDHHAGHKRESKAEHLIRTHNTGGIRLLWALKVFEKHYYEKDNLKNIRDQLKLAKDKFAEAQLEQIGYQRPAAPDPDTIGQAVLEAMARHSGAEKERWLNDAKSEAKNLLGEFGFIKNDQENQRQNRTVTKSEKWTFTKDFEIELKEKYRRTVIDGASGPSSVFEQDKNSFKFDLTEENSTTNSHISSKEILIKQKSENPKILLTAEDKNKNKTQLDLLKNGFKIEFDDGKASTSVDATDSEIQVAYKNNNKDKKVFVLTQKKQHFTEVKKLVAMIPPATSN